METVALAVVEKRDTDYGSIPPKSSIGTAFFGPKPMSCKLSLSSFFLSFLQYKLSCLVDMYELKSEFGIS